MSGEGQDEARARDHLANERTYLAWLRTALNVMVLGLAIAKFASDDRATSFAAGGLLLLVGASGVAYGTRRYHKINAELNVGAYQTGTHGNAAIVTSAVLVTAVIAALMILLLGD